MRFAIAPQRACGRAVGRNRRVRGAERFHRASERFGRIGLGRGLDQHERVVTGGKRPGEMEPLAHEVEEKARAAGPEVRSDLIGLAVLEGLRQLDLVSYMRFASVYKGFDNVEDFERELVELQKSTEPKGRQG